MNIAEIVTGSVASITAQMGEMSADQLTELGLLEAGAESPRSTLIKAIDERLAFLTSADEAGGADAGTAATAAAANEASASQTAVAADANAEQGAANFAEQHAAVLAQNDTIVALQEELASQTAVASAQLDEIAALKAELDALKAKKVPAKVKDPKAVALTVDAKATGLNVVVFADENDMSIPQIPALMFDDDAFVPGPDGAIVLKAPISFPVQGPPNDVCSVWLLAKRDGQAGRVCRLVAPMGTGGGRSAELPADYVMFAAA